MNPAKVSQRNNRSFLIEDRYGYPKIQSDVAYLTRILQDQKTHISIAFRLNSIDLNISTLILNFFKSLSQIDDVGNRVQIDWQLGPNDRINDFGLQLQISSDLPFNLTRISEKKILLVDPDYLLKELMILNYLNRTVDLNCAMNGKDAFRMVDRHQYDVVVTELYLDYFSGWELISYLKLKNYEGEIIVLSDKETISENMNILHRMNLAYVTKPIDIDQFNERIEIILKSGRYERNAS